MIELAVFIVLLNTSLHGLLNNLQSERQFKTREGKEALIAIKKALLETRRHVELSAGVRNRDKEFDIAELWSDASVKARSLNLDLANRLLDKSKYWGDKIVWSEQEILEKEIDFDSIEATLDALMKKM
jgi:hypothetical protein